MSPYPLFSHAEQAILSKLIQWNQIIQRDADREKGEIFNREGLLGEPIFSLCMYIYGDNVSCGA